MKLEGVRNGEAIVRRSEGLRRGEDAFAEANQSHEKKKVIGSPRRRTSGLAKFSHFFLPFFAFLKAHFLRPINFVFFRLVEGSVFGRRTPSLGFLLSSS